MDIPSDLKFAIVAGETSGDVLGAGLISELSRLFPDAEFFGIGGPEMQAAGCKILFDMERIGLMGLNGLFDKLLDILNIRSSLFKRIIFEKPNIFIGIDVPDFNIGLEKKLKKSGITTVHYVSPTVWAWRGYRIHKIKRAVNHMLALFPFEKRYYEKHKIPVTCVGHPIADEIQEPDRTRARADLNCRFDLRLSDDDVIIAVLPGSRDPEVRSLSLVFTETLRMVHQKYPHIRFALPFANRQVKQIFLDCVGDTSDLPLIFVDGYSRLLIEACDLALLASGTAALEAALLERPHVVSYKLSSVTWWLFKFLRHVDYYSMSNQLLPDPVVPELMQGNATAENIFNALDHYLTNPGEGRALEIEFKKIRKALQLNANLQAGKAIACLIEAGN